MANNPLPEFFTDDVVQVSYADGVFRILFAQVQGKDGAQRPVFRLLVPLNRLPVIAGELEASQKEIAEKMQARMEGGEAPNAPDGPPEAPPSPEPVPTPEAVGESTDKEKSLWSRIKGRVQSPKAE